MGKNKNNKRQNNRQVAGMAPSANALASENAAEPVVEQKPEEMFVNIASLSDMTAADPTESIVSAPSVSENPIISEQEPEETIVIASSPAINGLNLCDVSFRSNASITEITFEKSPTAQQYTHARSEDDDYLPGIAASEDDNILNLSESVPLDTLDTARDPPEDPDLHQNDPMFVRAHDQPSTHHDRMLHEEVVDWSVVSSATNYVNNRLLRFVDAMDLTQSSDIADTILKAVEWEYFLRRHAPLPLFVIELLIFLPRFQMVTFIFLLRICYNLICFGVRAHVFMASIPLQMVESLLIAVFQVVVSLAVMFLNQVPGGHTVPKGLNGHSGSKHGAH